MRKFIIAVIIAAVAVVVSAAVLVAVFFIQHPTHYKYNDSFVIGNSVENIIERYGEFDIQMKTDAGGIFYAGYIIEDDIGARLSSFFFGLGDCPKYQIYFKDCVAVRVELSHAWIGG